MPGAGGPEGVGWRRLSSVDLTRLFALGANDARTPLATLNGYARTLASELAGTERASWAATVKESAEELEEIVERLALVARIHEGRYTPVLVEVPLDELAAAAVAALGAERVELSGHGEPVLVERAAVEDALTACARATMRHGPLERVSVDLEGRSISFGPVLENARPVLAREEMREFGLGAALLVLDALGSELSLEGERFVVALPQKPR